MARQRQSRDGPPAPPKSRTVSGFRDAYKKAVTELLILRLLRDHDMYAYEMQREMELRSAGALTFNTLYLAIYRLKDLIEKSFGNLKCFCLFIPMECCSRPWTLRRKSLASGRCSVSAGVNWPRKASGMSRSMSIPWIK